MKIVLVMLLNFQRYIIDNIKNLQRFDNRDITVIADKQFHEELTALGVICEDPEKLVPDYAKYVAKIKGTFRNGFWQLASYRFKVLLAYMRQFKKTDIIHLENDVMVYKDLDTIPFHDTSKLLLTMDSANRCIPGIMFIPNADVLDICYKYFDPKHNDMANFGRCYHKHSKLVDTLPIYVHPKNKKETVKYMVSHHFPKYNMIFDTAAIGQYLGGVDPRNDPRGKMGKGFVNETCVINYSKNKFSWKDDEKGRKVPWIHVGDAEYPVINLHIHCKDLARFIVM